MGPLGLDDDLRELSGLLWRHREHLERVEYLLEVQHLLVAGGRDRWLARSGDELRSAVAALAGLDHQRAELLARLAHGLGRPAPLALRDLAAHAPAPWDAVFAEHLEGFGQQVQRLGDAAATARATLAGGLDAIQGLLRSLGGVAGGGYDQAGRSVGGRAGSLLFDGRA